LDRLGYLGYYREYWNLFLSDEDHEHDEGEDTTECYNCILESLAAKLSPFERAWWNWYNENVTPFATEHGIVRDTFKGEGLQGAIRKMALKILSEIHRTFAVIQADMVRQKKAEA
jgi:hypothetical protein